MAKKEFNFDGSDLLLLRKFYKKAPVLFARSVVNTLNSLAFTSRTALLATLNDQMTIRDPRFVARQMKVDKAKGTDFMNAESEVGSVSTNRFSGWIEQETGKRSEKNRTTTLLARGGSESNKVRPKNRLKPTKALAKISDFKIKARRQHRLIIFLQMMSRQKKSFLMPRKYKGLKRGVYVTSRNKLHRIYTTEPMNTKKSPWMKPTIKRVITSQLIRNTWAEQSVRVLPRRLR